MPPYQGRHPRPASGAPLGGQPDLSDRLGFRQARHVSGPTRYSYDARPYPAGPKAVQTHDGRRPAAPSAHRESTSSGNLLARLDGNGPPPAQTKPTNSAATAPVKPQAPLAARIDGTHAIVSNGGQSQSLTRQTSEDSRWSRKGFQPATPVGGKPGSSSSGKQHTEPEHATDLTSRIEPKEVRGRSRRSPVAPGSSRLSLEDRISSTVVDHIDLTRDTSSPVVPSTHSRASSRGSRGNTPIAARTAPSLLQRLNGPPAQPVTAQREPRSRQSSITSDMSLSTSDVLASSPPRPVPPPDMNRSDSRGEASMTQSGTAVLADRRPHSLQHQGPAYVDSRETALRPDRHRSHSAARPTPAQLAAPSAGALSERDPVAQPARVQSRPVSPETPPSAVPATQTATKESTVLSGGTGAMAAQRIPRSAQSPPRALRPLREAQDRAAPVTAASAPNARRLSDEQQLPPIGSADAATARSSSQRRASSAHPCENAEASASAGSKGQPTAPAGIRPRQTEAGTPPLDEARRFPIDGGSAAPSIDAHEAGTPPLGSPTDVAVRTTQSTHSASVIAGEPGLAAPADTAPAVSRGDGAAQTVKTEPRSPGADRPLVQQSGELAGADVKPVVNTGAPRAANLRLDRPAGQDAVLEERRKLEAAQHELDTLRRQEALLERLQKEREASARAKEHAENLKAVEAAEKAAAAAKRLRENLDREKAQLQAAQRAQRAAARNTAGVPDPRGAPPDDDGPTSAVQSPNQALPQSGPVMPAIATGDRTWAGAGIRTSRNAQQGQFSEQGNRLRDYLSFCSDVGVPPFPITDALLVLYAAAASPLDLGEKKRKQFVHSLRSLAKTIEPLWQRNGEYEQLRDWPNTALALATWKALGNLRTARNAYVNDSTSASSDRASPCSDGRTQATFVSGASLVPLAATLDPAEDRSGPTDVAAGEGLSGENIGMAAEPTALPPRKRPNSAALVEIPPAKQPRVAGFARDGNTTADSDVDRDSPSCENPATDVKPGIPTNSLLRVPGTSIARSSLFRRLSPCPALRGPSSSQAHPVAAFLIAFDPSLIDVAEPLIAAGFDSIADLARFAQLEVDTRLALLEQLHAADDCLMLDADVWSRFEGALTAVKARRWL